MTESVSVTSGEKRETHIAKLVLFPDELFPPPGPFVDAGFGGNVDAVALYACRVANMYPGPVEVLPLLMVLLIT